MKAADVARLIERNFTTDLEYYSFDKTLCMSCPHNTNNMTLFCEGGCGKCANRKCLEDMNTAYLVERAVQMLGEHPTAMLARSTYNSNDMAAKRLVELGYELETLPYYTDYPEMPEEPEAEDYETTEEYEEARRITSRSRRTTRLNARTYCEEARRGIYRSMSLSGVMTFLSVTWKLL